MRKKKVFLIEDSATDAAVVKYILDKEGFEVAVASSGEEGIEKACVFKPDLILLDLGLPGIDGYETCERLKSEISLSNAKIVVLSAKDEMSAISQAFNAGADDYIIKPDTPNLLADRVKEYLDTK